MVGRDRRRVEQFKACACTTAVDRLPARRLDTAQSRSDRVRRRRDTRRQCRVCAHPRCGQRVLWLVAVFQGAEFQPRPDVVSGERFAAAARFCAQAITRCRRSVEKWPSNGRQAANPFGPARRWGFRRKHIYRCGLGGSIRAGFDAGLYQGNPLADIELTANA